MIPEPVVRARVDLIVCDVLHVSDARVRKSDAVIGPRGARCYDFAAFVPDARSAWPIYMSQVLESDTETRPSLLPFTFARRFGVAITPRTARSRSTSRIGNSPI